MGFERMGRMTATLDDLYCSTSRWLKDGMKEPKP